MDKRVIFNTGYLCSSFASRVVFGEKGSVPIDQSFSQSFNIDPNTGRPMSDVQRLVKMQNDMQIQAAFAQLPEFKSKFLDEKMSDTDALKFMCPRLSQLPSELLKYRQKFTEFAVNKELQKQQLLAARQKAVADAAELESFKREIINSKNDSL